MAKMHRRLRWCKAGAGAGPGWFTACGLYTLAPCPPCPLSGAGWLLTQVRTGQRWHCHSAARGKAAALLLHKGQQPGNHAWPPGAAPGNTQAQEDAWVRW